MALLVAAHATLGCCAHHACGRGVACEHQKATPHAACDCHDGSNQASAHDSADEEQLPLEPCRHGQCTFVKANFVEFDQSSNDGYWVAAEMPAEIGRVTEQFADVRGTRHSINSNWAHLYVCYCALLI